MHIYNKQKIPILVKLRLTSYHDVIEMFFWQRCLQLVKRNIIFKFFVSIIMVGSMFIIWNSAAYGDDDVYRSNYSVDYKYILLWTRADYAPFYYMGTGQEAFIDYNCAVTNCYVTANKKFFGHNVTRFDAIAFNGRNLANIGFPQSRSPHQKYIYVMTESASRNQVCEKKFDNFFNWTATYKLNSDILYNYFIIADKHRTIVGPTINMTWIPNMEEIDDNFDKRLQKKSKAAAWFVSNCNAKSGRDKFASELKDYLRMYNLTLDIYGKCGSLKCPRDKDIECKAMLEKDYHFYLSLENSFADDYVTEKLLTAVQHDTIPIVYGGADYNRFLPPGSYIYANGKSAKDVAALMHFIIRSPKRYKQFFKWKKYYSYYEAISQNVCNLCAALNNDDKFNTITTYPEFRKWWNVEPCHNS